MKDIHKTGRIFYSIAIAGMGLQTIIYNSFPYMLLPPMHFVVPGLTYILGAIFIVAAACIVFEKKARQASLLLGSLFLLICCFCHIPYELIADPNYKQAGEWENAAKTLAFAGGAFAIAGCFPVRNKNSFINFLAKLIPTGAILFAITIVYFGILHFVYGKEASPLVPAWIPAPLFWIYFCGVALIGSGMAIILKIKMRLFAGLLGLMVFIWFAMLHIPRVVVAAPANRVDEITSAFLALAYSGIALVIAGNAK
jgi:uncharacterized membrane protein